MTDIVTLDNGHWQVEILPSLGGVVLAGRVATADGWTDVMRRSPEPLAEFGLAASYPLVPWSNRIRDARFTWKGAEHQLLVSHPDGTAIHGTAADKPWVVESADATSIVLTFDSADHDDINWPWHFTARLAYVLEGDTFGWDLSVTNASDQPFPAGLGHHPYFVRSVGGADAHLQLNCRKGYDLTDCMPTAAAGTIRPELDFQDPTLVGGVSVDDCYTDRNSDTLATITWPGQVTLDIAADDAFGHAVVYIPVGKPFFAVEPVTHANDGFNLAEQGVRGLGVAEVAPGETFAAVFSITATVG